MDVIREVQIQTFAFVFGGIRVASKIPQVRTVKKLKFKMMVFL